MVTPTENRTTLRPYVQVNGGITNYYECTAAKGTAEIGAKLTSGRLSAEAGAHLGTEVGGHAKVNYNLPIGVGASINFQGGASYTKSLTNKQNASINVKSTHIFDTIGKPQSIKVHTEENIDYKPDLYKANVGVALEAKPSYKFNFALGGEVGVRGKFGPQITIDGKEWSQTINFSECNKDPNVSADMQGNVTVNGKTPDIKLNGRRTELYATPTISANYNVNKNLTIGLQGNLNEAGAKVSWTF